MILKITVKVDGMMCGMCESHVNDAVRKAFSVKKVTAKGKLLLLQKMTLMKMRCAPPSAPQDTRSGRCRRNPTRKRGCFIDDVFD